MATAIRQRRHAGGLAGQRRGKYGHPEDDQDKPLDPNFEGFGRVPVDAEGRFRFTTIKPGTVEGLKGTTQAPHLVVLVFARGLVKHLLTRIYFDGEPANVTIRCLNVCRRNAAVRCWPSRMRRASISGM